MVMADVFAFVNWNRQTVGQTVGPGEKLGS